MSHVDQCFSFFRIKCLPHILLCFDFLGAPPFFFLDYFVFVASFIYRNVFPWSRSLIGRKDFALFLFSHMNFVDDNLGTLVLNHIAEQTRRFDVSQEKIQRRVSELEEARRLQQYALQSHPPQPLAAAAAAAQGEKRGGYLTAVPLDATVHSSAAGAVERRATSCVTPGSGPADDEYVVVDEGSGGSTLRQMHMHQATDSSLLVAHAPHRNEAERYKAAIEDSPVVINLQNTVSHLEGLVHTALRALDSNAQRVHALEQENVTLRYEVQTLAALVRDMSVAQTAAAAATSSYTRSGHSSGAVQFLLQHNASAPSSAASSPARAARDSHSRDEKQQHNDDKRESRALYEMALNSDPAAAAASVLLYGSRTSGAAAQRETVCDQCFGKALCTACAGCNAEWYCSAACALMRRDKHKMSCDMLRTMKEREEKNNTTRPTAAP